MRKKLSGNLPYSGEFGLLAAAGRYRTALLCGLLAYVVGARAQTPGTRVLVVYNANDSDSRRVAKYYRAKRAIPKGNGCALRIPRRLGFDQTAAVPWDEFDGLVRKPVRKCLKAAGRDAILYIVLSYRTPYRLVQVPMGSGKALDSFLADVWDEAGAASPERNPYFAPSDSRAGFYPAFLPLASYRREAGAKEVYSVWRLDGPSAAAAMGLVDHAIEAERFGLAGQACIDRRAGETMSTIPNTGYGAGEWELHGAAELLRAAGLRVVEDAHEEEFGTPPAPARCDDAVFYAGWYSLNHYNDAFTWAPGAIGIHLDSESAEDPRGGPNWSANALKRGITVTSGAVAEPYLTGLPHPNGIVHDLLAGASVGDAFLRNTLMLKWMIVNLGDPLCQPPFVPSRQRSLAPSTKPRPSCGPALGRGRPEREVQSQQCDSLARLPLPPPPHARSAAATNQYALSRHSAAYWAVKTRGMDFAVEDNLDTPRFNRILWQGLMGNVPYPAVRDSQNLRKNRAQLLAHFRHPH